MFRDLDHNESKTELINKAINILSNKDLCLKYMLLVTKNWNNSTFENLSNITQNRKAWLGQAACCYAEKIPEYLVREAWMQMKEENRIQANNIADKVIFRWELITLMKINGKKLY